MKVLERKTWSIEITCANCKSRLEIEAGDVRRGEFGSMGDYETEYYVDCAVCGATIRFGPRHQAKRIPDHVKNKAKVDE